MDLNLNDKIVYITGGSRGIGLATALAFAKEGAKVLICARDAGQRNRRSIHAPTEGDTIEARATGPRRRISPGDKPASPSR